MKLGSDTIETIERCLSHETPLEIRVERDKVVLVQLGRKVISKDNYEK
jgi:hypothetical protein